MTAYEKWKIKFEEKTKTSKELYEDALKYLPGGVSGSARYMVPYPLFIAKAKDCRVIDVDGNEYVDFLGGNGPLILGHSPAVVTNAVKKQLENGILLGTGKKVAAQLAKKICQLMPGMEKVSFVNSGSEAVHMALRLARAYTGKNKIAKFEGHYHGQLDNEIISTFSFKGTKEKPEPTPDSLGIDKAGYDNTVILPFNDIDSTVAIIEEQAKDLAAVIMEPLTGAAMGAIPAEKSFMDAIRKVTEEKGVLLIWDEVITGFRLGLSGAASHFKGIIPDIRCLGKIIGGGFPVGAFGGKKEILNKVIRGVAPAKTVWQSGTFSGNAISMTAGLATLRHLEKEAPYAKINAMGDRLRDGWRTIGQEQKINIDIAGIGSIARLAFTDKTPNNLRDYLKRDLNKEAVFQMGLICNGILGNIHHYFISSVHSDHDIDQMLNTSKKIIKDIKKSG